MKTWNEIEQRLKTENTPENFPAGLHDQIMRSVRDDRAAASIANGKPHHYAAYWLMGGALAMAVAGMVSLLFLPLPDLSAPIAAKPSIPGVDFSGIESYATAPMQTEVEALRSDLTSAARFVVSIIPGNQPES